MKRKDIIFKVIDVLQSNYPNFNVQTDGDEGEAVLPAIIVNDDVSRLSGYQGNTPLSGYQRDTNGNVTGVILQRYYQMDLNLEVKSHSEEERDDTLSDISSTFSTFEWDADLFHGDTTEWSVGDIRPRNNPVIEPDWYEAGLTIQFVFVNETVHTDNVDAITSIPQTINNNE